MEKGGAGEGFCETEHTTHTQKSMIKSLAIFAAKVVGTLIVVGIIRRAVKPLDDVLSSFGV